MQTKMLENEAKKYQMEALKEKQKTKQILAKGNNSTTLLYIKNVTHFEAQANLLRKNAASTQGFAADIRNVSASTQ
jgi:hypothetical protein